ncbi:MAG: PDDEXK nuclease domain-containing protein [Bacteroidota bacterium]|nr:PDDEXK nuclease domain-containing protein [Bacteroidota bacterium]
MTEKHFANIIFLIKQSRDNAIKAVNVELVNLYWNVGAYINKQLSESNWGEKTVDELADYIQKSHPELKGFNRRGLYRMKQFYEIYSSDSIVSPVMTQLQVTENQLNKIVSLSMTQLEISDIRTTILAQVSWTHHLTLIGRTKTSTEREFYLKLTIKENYSVKELDRQINSGLFERTMLGNKKTSPQLNNLHPEITNAFKDTYVFEFLNLPEPHTESDLQKGLIKQMKNFILELGKDFLYIGEEFKVQVGKSDFFIDLVFYHRGLQCLVAFELKTDKFKPEQLGQLNFYLEALDRDVKKQHENPSIGILLCKDKDSEVVEYAMSRSLSPTMVAEYKTQLPDKKILQQKLHELFEDND